jgi:hypothetical protein
MFGDNRYIELSLDEIISIQENDKRENKKLKKKGYYYE